MAGDKDNGRITLVMVFQELRDFRANVTDRLARVEQQLSGYSDVKKTAYEAHNMARDAMRSLEERRKLWAAIALTALATAGAWIRDWWTAR